ncbi:unnamed protein product, partial [Anisakis simplex]
ERITSLEQSPESGLTSFAKERIYHPRRSTDDDDLTRGSSRRTSRYKSKMEKARKEFLSTDTSPTSDPYGDRFRQSQEDLQRPRPEYRGTFPQQTYSNGDWIPK